jgi:DNA-binding transcriptional LysR family regulator
MVPIDVRQLECFIAVAEERHFGRAAARLHMTQPPLTRRITRLERDIGAQLFVRTRAGVDLTGAGSVLLERAHRIVELSRNAVERTRLAGAGQAGTLAVGYMGSTAFDLVPRLLRQFLEGRPYIRLEIEQARKDVQADAIRDGRMHLGFNRQYRPEPGLAVRDIAAEPLYAAVPDDHPLRGKAQVRLSDICTEPLVLFPSAPRPSFADEVTQMLMETGGLPRIEAEAGDVLTALTYVAAARLCAVVPQSVANVALPGVAFLPIADAPPESFSCIYRAGPVPALVREFLDFVDQADGPQPG